MSTKINTVVDALGNPTAFVLTPGQACDLDGSDKLLPGIEAKAILADKAYDADERVIEPLLAAGKEIVIPSKKNRTSSTLQGGCLQEITFQLSSWYRVQESAPCPCCGKSLKWHSTNTKTLHTMQGSITLDRPYFYCPQCKSGYYPLDHALELAGEAYQYDMQEKMLGPSLFQVGSAKSSLPAMR